MTKEDAQFIVEVFNDKPVDIGWITITKRYLWIFRKKRKVTLTLRCLSEGVCMDICAKLLETTTLDDLKGLPVPDQILTTYKNNPKVIAEAILMAVANDGKKVSKSMVKAFLYQHTSSEIHEIFRKVYRRLDIEPFFGSMGLARGIFLNLIPEVEAHGQG